VKNIRAVFKAEEQRLPKVPEASALAEDAEPNIGAVHFVTELSMDFLG
jgi:hypothetical protein